MAKKGLGLRASLFLVALALTLAVLIPGGLYLQHELRRTTGDRVERELQRDLDAARVLAESGPPLAPTQPRAIDELADRLGGALGCRVTFIAADGRVLGDSEIAATDLAALPGHAGRPEVVEALAGRRARVVDGDLLYLAERVRGPHLDGVVRVARPLVEVQEALARLRWLLVIAGIISLAVGVALSAAAAHTMSRTLSELVDSAHALAGGSPQPGPLAGSLKRLAQEIERTVAALASERARSAAVLEGMSEGVIALDGDSRVTLMNRAAHELLGSGEGAVGRALLELVRVPALDELVRSGQPRTAEMELAATGRRVLARLAPQPGSGAILVLHDVTALHRLETIRRDFVANASHELRTPVSVISANAETLRAGALADPVTAPTLIEAIHRNAVRLTSLITDLLDLSRLEAGRFRIELARVPLVAAAQRAVEAVERMAERRRTAISIDRAPAELAASADASALHQVLVNLLANAIAHTPEGTHVAVAAGTGASGRVRIEVRDDGPGIPPAHRQRIFERFYRIDPGRSRDMGGTGLGLSIVKHLVESMGGRVGVRQNRPRGSIFWVELDAGPVALFAPRELEAAGPEIEPVAPS
ncbi:MAG TPA: ATP-binding protein [Kofleriaceae bacterium]|nr:ATP-binding protein [Kofleriaceae bacterium]